MGNTLDYDYNEILDIAKQHYSIADGTDEDYWNKARRVQPDLPEYKDVVSEGHSYPADPDTAIVPPNVVNASLENIDKEFKKQDTEMVLDYVEKSTDYPPEVKQAVKEISRLENTPDMPGQFGYGPYAIKPFDSDLLMTNPLYNSMHKLFTSNPEAWESNAYQGAYTSLGIDNSTLNPIMDKESVALRDQEKNDWVDKIKLIKRAQENERIQGIIGEDNLSGMMGGDFTLGGMKAYNLDDFGDWEEEGRYISLFGSKLPLPKYTKDSDGLYKEMGNVALESKKNQSIFTLFGDEWLTKRGLLPYHLKQSIMVGLNNSIPGLHYAIESGKEMHDINYEDYDPGFLGHLTEFGASMSDPISVGSFFIPYMAGGKLTAHAYKKSVGAYHKYFYQGSSLQKWFANANGRYMMNKISYGTVANGVKKDIKKLMASDELYSFIYNLGGFGTMRATFAGLNSRKNQKMNLGKYEGSNGTINYWDTVNDSWEGWKEGAAMSAVLQGSHMLFGRGHLWQSKQFPAQSWSSIAKKAALKSAELGVSGGIMTTVPLMLNEDIKKQYYDDDGNFDYGKWSADTLVNTGIYSLFWGIRNFDLKSLRPKKPELDIYKGKYEPSKGDFTGDSKVDMSNIVIDSKNSNSMIIPRNRNLPNFLNTIKSDIIHDIKHENLKVLDVDYSGNEENNLINISLENVSKEMGPETPFEFFDESLNIDAGQVDTVRGLKSIQAIVNDAIEIQNKAAITDDDGNIMGVDTSKLTVEDANYLLYVVPSALSSYQGYTLKYHETDEGRQEYIKRYELEKNNGKPLTDEQRKIVLKALDMRVKRFDIIKKDFNSALLHGDTKGEQIISDNKSSLSEDMWEVVNIDSEGNPVTGDILYMNKEEAIEGINQGKLIKKSDAEKQGMDIGEVESFNQGKLTEIEREDMLAAAVEKGIAKYEERKSPQSPQIPKSKGDYPEFIKPFEKGKPGYGALDRKINSKMKASDIKHPYDIAVLAGPDSPISAKELTKRVPSLNSLMKSSGKDTFTEITTDDIRKWGEDRIAEIKKENAGKHINLQKPAVMQNNPISNVKKIFQALVEKDLLKLNPVTEEVQKYFSSHATKTKQTLKAKQTGLPELKTWYEKLPEVYSAMMAKNKNFSIALHLIDHLSVRAMEVGHLKGEHILRDSETNIPYLDLMTPTTEGGAGKGQGVLRPVPIPESLYKELIKIADKKASGSKLFPGYQKILTKELQKVFPSPKYIKVVAGDFKNQQLLLAKRYANLSPEENRIFNTISGHAADASAIVQEYLAKGSMGDLLKLQVNVMKKVNAARLELEKDLKTSPIEKVIEKFMKYAKEDLTFGLSIKDVKGKPDKDVIKTIETEVREGTELQADVKKKFVLSVNNLFNNLTKGLDVGEKDALISFYAQEAQIEDYNNFNINSATSEELVLFSSHLIKQDKSSGKKGRNYARKIANISLSKQIFEANNYNKKQQQKYIQTVFFPEKKAENVSLLHLNHKQSVELVSLLKGDELLNTVYDADNNIIKDKFDYVHLAVNVDNISNLSKQLPGHIKTALVTGFMGPTNLTFPWLAKKLNAPQLVKIGEDLTNRRLAETRVSNYIQGFETNIYKAIYNYAKAQGDWTRLKLLMPHIIKGGAISIPGTKLKTNLPLISLPDLQSVGRSLIGDEKHIYKYGMKIFDKHIKDNMWSLDPRRMEWMREHVLKHPEDKVGVARFNRANPFYEGIYVTEGNYKELGLTKKSIGSLRTDTMESYIAREWSKYTDKLWEHTLLVLQKGMTDAQWNTFIKKYPLVEIKKYFYIPIIHTEQFGDYYGFGQINIERRVEKAAISHAKRLAKEEYGDIKLKNEHIDEFMDKGTVEAWNDAAVAIVSKFQGNKQNPKHLLRRQLYVGERVFIEKENKWIDTMEHTYDMTARPHAASMGKTVANIEYFPYMVGIPGLKFNGSYPKVLMEIGKKGGIAGKYIHDMILSETGLTTPDHWAVETVNRALLSMNKYASRLILMGFRSPIKNLLIGATNNALGWDGPAVLRMTARSLSYKQRIEARETGYMALSLSKLTENEDKLLSVILDKMWHSFKFGSTEESARLTSMLLAYDEVPVLADCLNSKNAKTMENAIYRAKNLYELSETTIEISKDIVIQGGELEILKKLGTDIDFKYDITKKDFGINRLITQRVLKEGKTEVFSPLNRDLTPIERAKIKDEIEKVHFKIISRAHERAQGSTAPLDQPLILQAPILAPGALFSKMAIKSTEWTFRMINEARRTNSWHKFLQYLTMVGVTTAVLTNAFDELFKGLANPRQLDRSDWKSIFRGLKTAEQGGIASFMWGVAEGQMPMGNPIFGFAQMQTLASTTIYLLEKFAQTTEALGIKPEGKGDFATFFIAKKTGWQAEKELFSKITGAYREWRAISENKMHPYREAQKQFDEDEKHFYNNVMPLSSKPAIVKNHINSAEYTEIKDAFELTEFEETGDFTRINEIVFSTFMSLYDQKLAAGNPPDVAAELASKSINSKFKALDPILNGLGQSGDHKGWMSIKDKYLLYLVDTARAQEKLGKDGKIDKTFYLRPLKKQKLIYDYKIKTFAKQFPGWIRKNKSKEMEKFLIKYVTQIHPESWKLLGLPDINSELVKRYEENLKEHFKNLNK